MEYCLTAFEKIDWEDGAFAISGPECGDRLRRSLARFGILDPPLVRKAGQRYSIIDGFKRLRWARENGGEAACCLVFPETLSHRELWERRIERRLFEAGLGLAEKVRIVAVLLDLFPSRDIPPHFLEALGVAPRADVLARWAELAATGPEVLGVLASGEIAERAALEVSAWDPQSRTAMLFALKTLRCSASIQVEIVERVFEIAMREEKTPGEIVGGPQAQEILSAKGWNHRRKTQALRDLLSRMRFPRLHAKETQFAESLASLGLPPSVRLVPPPAFEGTGWKLELSFSDARGLGGAIGAAAGLAGSEGLARIIETRASRPEPEK